MSGSAPAAPPTFLLTTTCPDAPGISAAIAGVLADAGGFILDSRQFGDPQTGLFFARIAFGEAPGALLDLDRTRRSFQTMGERFAMDWSITPAADRPRTAIAVSRFGHCLSTLLEGWHAGSLPVEVVAVVSNHENLRATAECYRVPFHHLPVTAATKEAQEARLADLLLHTRTDLLVLARYMQVLSPALVERWSGRCINIHHSFLPSFAGARPYRQAHDRGVKLIGATAHYVTGDLDEGPIIEQDVERVGHDRSAAELVEIGSEIEARVLARAVRWHAERRVFLNARRTIVFR